MKSYEEVMTIRKECAEMKESSGLNENNLLAPIMNFKVENNIALAVYEGHKNTTREFTMNELKNYQLYCDAKVKAMTLEVEIMNSYSNEKELKKWKLYSKRTQNTINKLNN